MTDKYKDLFLRTFLLLKSIYIVTDLSALVR